jgi:hypothetical protein
MIQSALDPNQYALLKVFPNLLSEKIVFPNQGLFVWLVADAGLF